MKKREGTELSIKSNDNNKFSLLIPYYNSDKWTNKLKRKIKKLADAYNDFYEKIEKENDPLYNKFKIQTNLYNKTARNFMKHNRLFSDQNLFLKTSTNFIKYKTHINFMKLNENNNINKQKKILNEILPPVMNFNPNFENVIFDGMNYYNLNDKGISYLSPKSYNLFCISAQQRNQHANMKKFYNNKKNKDIFDFEKHKSLNNTRNLFSSKAHNDDFNKFLNEFKSKNRINFFKKNDYNPHIKSDQPKDRKQISALKDTRKKQYLDYIKAKSEDNYMKFYYYQ